MRTSELDIPPGPLLVIVAHPDDELLAAALIAAYAAAGYEVRIVSLTRGEAGLRGPNMTTAELGAHRVLEMQAACTILGASAPIIWSYPDDGLEDCDPDDAIRALLQIYDDLQPRLVIRLPADGVTGHRGHTFASKVALESHQKAARRDALFWEPVATPAWANLPLDQFMCDGAPLRIYPGSSLAMRLGIRAPLRSKKIGAIKAHESQASSLSLLWPAIITQEAYLEVSL